VLEHGIAQSGVRHLVSTGQTSWYGFAEAIIEEAHARGLVARRPVVEPITTSEFPTRTERPAWSVLDAGRIENEYALRLPAWRDGLCATLDMARDPESPNGHHRQP